MSPFNEELSGSQTSSARPIRENEQTAALVGHFERSAVIYERLFHLIMPSGRPYFHI
jgi:hypothetical protein